MSIEEEYTDVRRLQVFKRLAVTKQGIERGADFMKNFVWEQIEKISNEANELSIDWNMVQIQLGITDSRLMRAWSEYLEDDSEFKEKDE